jgi:MoxR-like ATPase
VLTATRPDHAEEFAAHFEALVRGIERAVIGKREVVEQALVCLLAGGHLLVEDVPGVGKTTLARCLAASLGASWQRIQFTPDLLPSDITGVTVYDQRAGAFEFHPGPVFANVVLGDEINRASPKTQSALLEVMEERVVTVDGRRHPVPSPFMVIATQNPVDMEGTYALPEAQLDRFLMRIAVGYPEADAEMAILTGTPSARAVETLPPVVTTGELGDLIELATRAFVAPPVVQYVIRIAAASRARAELRLGASPRGSLALLAAARVRAMAAGRGFVVPEDVRALAGPVLAHRLLLTPEAELQGRSGAAILAELLAGVPVPQPAGPRES